jgi:phage terminase large subunit-like protein
VAAATVLVGKGAVDRAPYDLWRSQGYLQTTAGNSVSYEFIAGYLYDLCRSHNVVRIGYDRWSFKFLVPWLTKAGFSEARIKDLFVEFGQGVASMSPALRDLEQTLHERRIAHQNHPVLNFCINNTVVAIDDAGNRKLSRKGSTGRIDGTVALMVALGVAVKPATKALVENMIV